MVGGEFAVDRFDNDIAIVKLESPLTFNDDVQPACLPHTSFTFETGDNSYVSGWGATVMRPIGEEPGPVSNILQYVRLPLITNTDCVFPKTEWAPTQITSNNVCAGFPNGGRDICQVW